MFNQPHILPSGFFFPTIYVCYIINQAFYNRVLFQWNLYNTKLHFPEIGVPNIANARCGKSPVLQVIFL